MIDSKDLTFNLVFTKGTPKYLWLFTLSILKHTTLNLRLVANGCKPNEVSFLRDKVKASNRLDLVIYPSKKVENHDTILNYLLELEDLDYLCFMDTDILATGDFVQLFIQKLSDYSFLCSCKPMWSENDTLPPDYPRMLGKFLYAESGLCLGNSYFAIYHKETLKKITEKYGVNFNRIKWNELPSDIQHILELENLKKKLYDTGKILNILLQHEGHKIGYFDSSDLYHIGGLSWYISKFKKRITWAREEKKVVKNSADELKKILKLRLNMNQYFFGFIRSLLNNKRFRKGNSKIFNEILEYEEVKEIRKEITAIYQEYYT